MQVHHLNFLAVQFDRCLEQEEEMEALEKSMTLLALPDTSPQWFQESYLEKVTSETSVQFSLKDSRTIHIILDKALTQEAVLKVEPYLKSLAYVAIDYRCRVVLSLMTEALQAASSKELVRHIIHNLGRLIVKITYADGGAHKKEAQENLALLIRNASGLLTLDCAECESMQERDLASCVEGSHRLDALTVACCSQLTSDVVRDMIKRVTFARTLSFAGCKRLDDKAFSSLAFCRFLRTLDLSKCMITDVTVAKLSQLSVSSLSLQKCQKITDGSLETLATFKYPLHYLNISQCEKLTDGPLSRLLALHCGVTLVSSFDHDVIEPLSKRFPFTTFSVEPTEVGPKLGAMGYLLQYLQEVFPGANGVVEGNTLRLIISAPPITGCRLPAAFNKYLAEIGAHVEVAYEVLTSSTFQGLASDFLACFQSVTVYGLDPSIPQKLVEIRACKKIKSLTFRSCPLRDGDLEFFASKELAHLKIEHASVLTKVGFERISDYFPNLRSLELRKCKNLDFSSIAKIALLKAEALEFFEFSLPESNSEDLTGLPQNQVIALLVKLSHSKRNKARPLIEKLVDQVEINLASYARLYCIAMDYKIGILSSKLVIWLDSIFNGAIKFSVQDDQVVVTVACGNPEMSKSVFDFLKGVIATEKGLKLDIQFGDGSFSQSILEVLSKIFLDTANVRVGCSFTNTTNAKVSVDVLIQTLVSQEKELSFENVTLGSQVIADIVKKSPGLERFQCDTTLSNDDIQALLKGCKSLIALRLAKANGPLFETIRSQAPQLKVLELRGLSKIGTIPAGGFSVLGEINLADSALNDKEIMSFANPGLELANFDRTKITAEGLAPFLKICSNLQVLSLAGACTDDSAFYLIAECNKKLREGYFRGCPKVTEKGLLALYRACTQLEVVDVMQCPQVNGALATHLLRNAKLIKKFVLYMHEGYSPEALEILMMHYFAARSLKIVACEKTQISSFEALFEPQDLKNLFKLAIEDFQGDDLALLELICRRLAHLTHFSWKGPLSFGAIATLAGLSKVKTLRLDCTDAKGIVDVDGAICKLEACSSLKHLTLLGFSEFSPNGLEKLMQKLPRLKSVTVAASGKMTQEAISAIQALPGVQIAIN